MNTDIPIQGTGIRHTFANCAANFTTKVQEYTVKQGSTQCAVAGT